MPDNLPVQVVTGTLPEDFCFETWQQTYNDFMSITQWFLSGSYNSFNYGNTVPATEDRVKPWLRLNADSTFDRWYVWSTAYGMWLAPHPIAAGDDEVRIWSGTAANIDFKDGGNANAVSDTDGPFWREANAYDARTIVGVGTLPDSGTVVAVNGTGGSDEVVLTTAQLPAHTHDVEHKGAEATGNLANPAGGLLDSGVAADYTFTSEPTGDGDPHTNMPPYIGVYFIVRTSRKFYAI